MARRILIIQGHPDRRHNHFGHALGDAYANGAEEAGHEVKRIDVADLDFPLMRTKEEFEAPPPDVIRQAQDAIRWADHLLILYPLWHGMMPALLKAFIEQVFRPGFAMAYDPGGRWPKQLLKGRSARIVVTMGMPAFIYRWYFGAHGLKTLTRSILRFSGIAPIKSNLIGMIEGMSAEKRERWLEKMRALGREGT